MRILNVLSLLVFCAIWKRALLFPLIVPQELPSVLSLIYSNIPPIKKGTDSRVGFGFRLGEHADFQVLYEIGPQLNTRKIGEQSSSDRRRQIQEEKKKPTPWLQRWAKDEADRRKPGAAKTVAKPTYVPQMTMDVVSHLQQLYSTQKPLGLGERPVSEQPQEIATFKQHGDSAKISADLADIEFD